MFNVHPKISTRAISRKILSVSDMKLKDNGHVVVQEILNERRTFRSFYVHVDI